MNRLLGAALAAALVCAACGKPRTRIIVGSKSDTEQTVLAEIVAQQLERRLNMPIERRLAIGGTQILYQALLAAEVSIYPEYTGIIGTVILKETPSEDPDTAYERARAEMLRLAQSELIGPLGFENPPVLVVRASEAPKAGTLSDVAEGKTPWKLGVTFEFQERADGLRALNSYRLPMAAAVRSMDAKQLFPALEKGDLTMIAATATDGRLLSKEWKALVDDRKVFPPHQAALVARQDVLNLDPRIRSALAELVGKFTQDRMRSLNAQVDVEKRSAADVAAAFLGSLGGK